MTTNKLILTFVVLAGVLFGLVHMENQKENKLFVIATVDVYHHIAHDEPGPIPKETAPVINTVQPKKETKPVAKTQVNPKRITKKGFEDNQHIQDLVNHAYKIGGRDFLLTLEGENGLWQRDRKSGLV
jgi:hypothetical protein